MDETEKYKQRLEAIAEKRRLQEEQDRARREMEDERLRLQQLKRKSLRDQWLMEGAPLSPTSLEAPRSPLWGSQAQEIEKNIDKLQSESQRLAEEEEKLKEQMEDGQMQEPVKVAETAAEIIKDVVVQNGGNNVEVSGDTIKSESSLDEPAVVLTNGGDVEVETSHTVAAQEDQPTTNGPTVDTKAVIGTMSSPGFSEAESGQVPNININEEEEEEEGTMVIRAECVIITDEGDDGPEDSKLQENQQEVTQAEETALPNQDGVETEETVTESQKSEARSVTAEEQPETGGGDVEGDVKPNENGTEEEDKSESPASVSLLSPAGAQEGATVASVPVYCGTQPSVTTTEAEAEAEAPQEAEVVLKPREPVTVEFQEIPLAEPKGNLRTGGGPGEHQPLLRQVKAPESGAAGSTADTPIPTRVTQGDPSKAPKRKTCQCCSVM